MGILSLSPKIAPAAVDDRGVMMNGINGHQSNGVNGGKVDTMNPHDCVQFDPSLKPKNYQIKGTDPNNKILFRDVKIIDSTGSDPFKGDVYVEGKSVLYQANHHPLIRRYRRAHQIRW